MVEEWRVGSAAKIICLVTRGSGMSLTVSNSRSGGWRPGPWSDTSKQGSRTVTSGERGR